MSSGSKKVNYVAIGLGAIAAVSMPAEGQSIVAFCIKVIAIAVVTIGGYSCQTWLDKKDGQQSDSRRDTKADV